MKQTVFTAILIIVFCIAAFAQTNENPRPNITISSSDTLTNEYRILIFSAGFDRQIENNNFKYKWIIKGGKILAGEETKTVAVLREYPGEGTVSVDIDGLAKNCNSRISKEFFIPYFDPPTSMQVDEYDKTTESEEKERIDSFFVALDNDPTAQGIIKIRLHEKLTLRLKFLSDYMNRKGYSKRISFFVSDQQARLNEFWIVPNGADSPDCKDCITIKAEDFEKLVKLFQPKPTAKKRKK